MKESSEFTSIPDLAARYGLDNSYLSKLVKKSGIKTFPALSKEKKACTAISDKDIAKLEKENPNLKAIDFDVDKHITYSEMAEIMGRNPSGLIKAIRKAGLELVLCRVATERTRTIKRKGKKAVKETVICSGKATLCLTKSQFEKFKASHSKIQLG